MTHVCTSVSDMCSTDLSMTTYQTTLLRKIVLDDSIINFFESSGRVTSKNLCFPTDGGIPAIPWASRKHDDSNCSPSDAAAPLQLLHGCCCHIHHIVFALIHSYFFLQHLGRFSQECEARPRPLSFTFITYPQIILHLLLGAWRGEHCHH